MSTRCQTFIKAEGKPVATIYRHCDGYPTGMGNDLCDMARKTRSPHAMVVKILTAWNFDAEIEEIDAKHGDTEYEYTVEFPKMSHYDSEPTITVKSLHTGKEISGDWLGVKCQLDQFQREN